MADPAGVDGRPGRPDGRPRKDRRQIGKPGESFRAFHRPAAGDDDIGLGHIDRRPGLAQDLRDFSGDGPLRDRDRVGDNLGLGAGFRVQRKNVGPEGGDRRPGRKSEGQEGFAGKNRPGEDQAAAGNGNGRAIGSQGNAQAGGKPGSKIPAHRRGRKEDGPGRCFPDEPLDGQGESLARIIG